MTKILVIDDETMLREEVIDWLNFEGYDAVGAENGMVGLEYARQNIPDLIVCDITMPRLDGYGVLLELHANAETTNIPFIFVTARAAHDDIRQGMTLGADDYITKPFTRDEFLQTVETRLNKKGMQDKLHQHEVDQLQQALIQEHQNSMLKAKMVAMFSHDFRNPLSVILSTKSLLRNYADRFDETRRGVYLDRIESAVRQLLQMLDDMLVVAQMEGGSLDLQPESLQIEKFIQDIIDDFTLMYQESHQIIYESSCADLVMTDGRLLRQVVSNLISNAVKYSPQGSAVHVALDTDDGYFVLSIQDQGIGIPEMDKKRLFSAFQRGSNVGNVLGTGLGLAIIKQALDLLGGSIDVESQVGVGTTMTVAIPNTAPARETSRISSDEN